MHCCRFFPQAARALSRKVSQLNLVAAGFGVAVVAASMRDQAPADVVFVPLAGDGGSTVAVMHHREAAPVIKHFVATLGELAGKQLAALEHS